MKNFLLGILGGFCAIVLMGAVSVYIGYNPNTGLNMIPGQWIDPTGPEVISSDDSCTWDTQHGGTNIGSFIARSNGTCHFTFTDNTAAAASAAGIAGYTCIVIDTDAASYLTPFKQTSNTATGCTVSGSTASGDHITYIMLGYAN